MIFAGPRVEELVIHDLRTPLNVIGLALKMLERQPAASDPELAEDLSFIRYGVADIERMISCLVEASRMPEDATGLDAETFDLREIFDETVEELRRSSGRSPVDVAIYSDGPNKVHLDRWKTKLAISHAASNVLVAAGRKPISIRLSGGPTRCIMRFESSVSAREGVKAGRIETGVFERLLGTAGERRGLDLAIVAMISNLFGGSAHLDVIPGQGTAVILDWPTRLPGNS